SPARACSFFFQAEDGIRDFHVTGVQTCALPIWSRTTSAIETRSPELIFASYSWARRDHMVRLTFGLPFRVASASCIVLSDESLRSEERRVGKECRSRWSRCAESK